MEHDWFYDDEYIPSEDSNHISRDLCVNCSCYRYWWIRIKNGKFEKHSYVLDRNTQYNMYTHECSGEFIKTTLF